MKFCPKKYCFYLVSLLFFGLISLVFIPKAYAQTASLSLSPSSGNFNRSCSFSLTINVNTGGSQTDGTDAILLYDPTRFRATSITPGTIYSDFPAQDIDEQLGRVTISGFSSVTSTFAGQGALATVDFTVLPEAPEGVSQIKFDFDPTDKAKTTDSNIVERGTIADILSQVGNGNYVISAGSGNCSSNPNPSPTIPIKPTIPQGDPNDPVVIPTKKPVILDQSADINTTVIIGSAGVILTLIAIFGLAVR